MRFILLFCLSIEFAHSIVEFSNSALYDVYDFKGVAEVQLAKCDNGCLIFAATLGGFIEYPEALEPYANNLIITNHDDGKTQSIAHLAQQKVMHGQKTPLTITGRGNISVVNRNDPDEKTFWTIVLYVVEKTKAEEISYEVYDLFYNLGKQITPQSDVVTFLSAYDIWIQSPASDQANSVTVRLTGFDNALDDNKDECPFAYKTPDGPSFLGFTIMATPPIISFAIERRNPITLVADGKFNTVRDIGVDGFITSPGWNGCTKSNNGGIQSFRPKDDHPMTSYMLVNEDDKFNVGMDVLPNFDDTHELDISDFTNVPDLNAVTVTGTVQQHIEFGNVNYLVLDFENANGDQGYILRYSSNLIPREATKVTTTTHPPPTTNSGYRATGFMISLLLLSLLI